MKTIRVCTICLIGFLAAGAVIAWSTVALAFIRFYRAEGTLMKVTNCRFPNPVMTPCFFPFQIDRVDASSVPDTRTTGVLIVGDLSRACDLSRIPNQGVGLARAEFIITNHIGIHPMALVRYSNLKNPQVTKDIAARIGSEDARAFFVDLSRNMLEHSRSSARLPSMSHFFTNLFDAMYMRFGWCRGAPRRDAWPSADQGPTAEPSS